MSDDPIVFALYDNRDKFERGPVELPSAPLEWQVVRDVNGVPTVVARTATYQDARKLVASRGYVRVG